MPRNLSAWIDLLIHLFVMLVLISVLSCYNVYVAAIGAVVWLVLAAFARERCLDRAHRFTRYCRKVVRNLNEMMNYAVEELPQAILVVNRNDRLMWCSSQLTRYLGVKPEAGIDVKDFWPNIIIDPIWGTTGEYVFAHEDHYYQIYHRPVPVVQGEEPLMAFYVQDISDFEHLKTQFRESRTVLCYIQIDNYDEVVQRQSEAERTSLLLSVNQLLDAWMKQVGGYMRRVSDDLYLVVMQRDGLEKAKAAKFDVLDKVRQLQNTNRLPITLSMGVAVAEGQSMAELGAQAQAGLDLALGRGGDQVAVSAGGKTLFFGGRTKAVEKHTRVKARVVAHAMREIIEGADEVFIMGHHNEDFDCFGAAVGVAKMARQLGKPFHIVLSDMNSGIEKFADLIQGNHDYDDIFIHQADLVNMVTLNPVLIVVDTHIPHLVAAPSLLERIPRVVVIDHHRRSESFIKNPLLVYIEPASSSTCELVTELLMYFSDDLVLSRIEATALYSGIVVDTKNFSVQTGVRTFDAAAYLRRSGADPVMVRHLFRSDYSTTVALARAEASSELFEGGIIVATCPEVRKNGQVIAAQTADSLLRIEDVRMSVVIFQLDAETVGISARSTGEINVQVIMEQFGGGGHQNVAGAQIRGEELQSIRERVIAAAKQYIEEDEKNESNSSAGH